MQQRKKEKHILKNKTFFFVWVLIQFLYFKAIGLISVCINVGQFLNIGIDSILNKCSCLYVSVYFYCCFELRIWQRQFYFKIMLLFLPLFNKAFDCKPFIHNLGDRGTFNNWSNNMRLKKMTNFYHITTIMLNNDNDMTHLNL